MAYLIRVDKNGTKHFGDTRCRKCGGKGYLHGYEHVEGGVCFRCGGHGHEAEYTWKEYTPEYAAKLAEKRLERARAKAPAENLKFFRKHGFSADGKMWIVIGSTYEQKDALKAAGARWGDWFGWHFDHEQDVFPTFEISVEDVADKTDVGLWWLRDGAYDFVQRKRDEHAPKTNLHGLLRWVTR